MSEVDAVIDHDAIDGRSNRGAGKVDLGLPNLPRGLFCLCQSDFEICLGDGVSVDDFVILAPRIRVAQKLRSL